MVLLAQELLVPVEKLYDGASVSSSVCSVSLYFSYEKSTTGEK